MHVRVLYSAILLAKNAGRESDWVFAGTGWVLTRSFTYAMIDRCRLLSSRAHRQYGPPTIPGGRVRICSMLWRMI